MEKNEIENKDQELIKKFRTIIHNKKKPAARPFPFWLFFVFTVLILSSILVFRQNPPPPVSTIPETSSRVQPAPVPFEQPDSNAGTMEIKPSSNDQKGPALPRKTAVLEAIPEPSAPVLKNPTLEQTSFAKSSSQDVQGDMPPGIQIKEIISCKSVTNRQHSTPKAEFSLAQDAAATVWMEVISETLPFTLTHVYYINEQKFCEVPLAVRYHRMRTWSSITLKSFDQIGRWRVEVVADNGIKLDQIEFTIVK